MFAAEMAAWTLLLCCACGSKDPATSKDDALPNGAASSKIGAAPKGSFHASTCAPSTTGIRWLDSDPHVPFALIDKQVIFSAEQPCCRSWAKKNSIWHAVDEWGKISGKLRLINAAYYDVTDCVESQFELLQGRHGVRLYFSGEGYRESANYSWQPSAKQKTALHRRLSQTMAATFRPSKNHRDDSDTSLAAAIGNATQYLMFFHTAKPGDVPSSPHRWAVSGGAVLTIWHLGESGWRLHSRLNGFSDEAAQFSWHVFYRPLAVFDINGDGVPNIVVHEDQMNVFWRDILLQLKDDKWQTTAGSIGGSTA